MLLIQALEFLIHRIDERVRKHLGELGVEVKGAPEIALASQLKFQAAAAAQPVFNPHFVQQVAALAIDEPKLDDIPLQIGGTWKVLMEKPLNEFADVLKNSLKDRSITLNKLLILTRFKRQLLAVSTEAQAELARREKSWLESEKKLVFENLVDDAIVEKVKASATEAQKLALIAVEGGKFEKTIPFTSKKVEINFNGAGRTEVTIMACEQAIEQFLLACKEQDRIRRKAPQDPLSMIDVFPGTLKANQVLTGLNQVLAEDLIARLFIEAEFNAYIHFRLSLPARLKTFPADDAMQSRKLVCEKLRDFDEKTLGITEDQSEYWLNLFKEIHALQTRLEPYKAFSPQFYLQKSTTQMGSKEVCQRFHSLVEHKAQAASPNALVQHREDCRL